MNELAAFSRAWTSAMLCFAGDAIFNNRMRRLLDVSGVLVMINEMSLRSGCKIDEAGQAASQEWSLCMDRLIIITYYL